MGPRSVVIRRDPVHAEDLFVLGQPDFAARGIEPHRLGGGPVGVGLVGVGVAGDDHLVPDRPELRPVGVSRRPNPQAHSASSSSGLTRGAL